MIEIAQIPKKNIITGIYSYQKPVQESIQHVADYRNIQKKKIERRNRETEKQKKKTQ